VLSRLQVAGVVCAAAPAVSSPPARQDLALSTEARSAPPGWVTASTCGSLAATVPETVRAVDPSVALQTVKASCEAPLSCVVLLLEVIEAKTAPSEPAWALLLAARALNPLSSRWPCEVACLEGDLMACRLACPCLASQLGEDGSPVEGSGLHLAS
jgi:hypothetical protein